MSPRQKKTVHTNLGLDGPSALNIGVCGSFGVDFKVDVDRFLVSEGRAGWGQVKIVACPKILSKIEGSIQENRV